MHVAVDIKLTHVSIDQHLAKLKQLVVDTDRDNVSFLGELVMGGKLRFNVTADPNVLQTRKPQHNWLK